LKVLSPVGYEPLQSTTEAKAVKGLLQPPGAPSLLILVLQAVRLLELDRGVSSQVVQIAQD
jgi:hypothetical protein